MDSADDEKPVTLNELIEIIDEEDEMVENADAVLGGSDDRNCTYLMGHVPRQALYACKTCFDQSENKEYAGVCLACSMECHDGHELFELYTKRNFRCDCGNKKFPTNFTCKLCPEKLSCNESNSYGQNFGGLYCVCSKPYPDPDDTTEDVMIQCVICEDWFHGRHILPKNVEGQDYEEMVCPSCMTKHPFLWSYSAICKGIFEREQSSSEPCIKADEDENVPADVLLEDKTDVSRDVVCKLQEVPGHVPSHPNSSLFFTQNWRKQLCSCSSCVALYDKHGLGFLTIEGDSIAEYEEKGKANSSKNVYEAKVSKLDHVQKVELLKGFMDLKSSLTEYLKKFAENGKIVRQEDIAEFFGELQERKRRRTENYEA